MLNTNPRGIVQNKSRVVKFAHIFSTTRAKKIGFLLSGLLCRGGGQRAEDSPCPTTFSGREAVPIE